MPTLPIKGNASKIRIEWPFMPLKLGIRCINFMVSMMAMVDIWRLLIYPIIFIWLSSRPWLKDKNQKRHSATDSGQSSQNWEKIQDWPTKVVPVQQYAFWKVVNVGWPMLATAECFLSLKTTKFFKLLEIISLKMKSKGKELNTMEAKSTENLGMKICRMFLLPPILKNCLLESTLANCQWLAPSAISISRKTMRVSSYLSLTSTNSSPKTYLTWPSSATEYTKLCPTTRLDLPFYLKVSTKEFKKYSKWPWRMTPKTTVLLSS